MVLTSRRRDRLANLPHRAIQTDKHSTRDNVMSDIEFGNFTDAGDCGNITPGQTMTSRNV
jgi:hypothetical protein